MTNLQCGVGTCAHNAQGCCCLGGIQINGQQACRCGDTSCSSFAPQTGAMQNSVGQSAPQPACQISCSAQACAHNRSGQCTASQVTVQSGPGHQTECASFRHK